MNLLSSFKPNNNSYCLNNICITCIFTLFTLLSISVQAQNGPVGINSGILTWLDASDNSKINFTPPTNGTGVLIWQDKSGNENHALGSASLTPNSKLPTYHSTGMNEAAYINFERNKTQSDDGPKFKINLDLRPISYPKVTIIAVYRQQSFSPGQKHAIWGNDNGGFDRFFQSVRDDAGTFGSVGVGFPAEQITIPDANEVGKIQLLSIVYAGKISSGVNIGDGANSKVYFNGIPRESFTDKTDATNALTETWLGYDGSDAHFNGDIAEVIIYNRVLTDCELEKINIYLSEKYGVDYNNITSAYDFKSTFKNDPVGIGKITSSCGDGRINSAASGIMKIFNPTSNNTTGSFILFAHNDGDLTSTTASIPNGFAKRIKKMWRIDKKGADNIGDVDISFNLKNIPNIDRDEPQNFALLLSGSSTFASSRVIFGELDGDVITFKGVTLNDNDYVTLAIETDIRITSNGGLPEGSIRMQEGKAAVTTVTAATSTTTSGFTYSIAGGSDQLKFTISTSGALSFKTPLPDFVNPDDTNGDRIYEVMVKATKGSESAIQTLYVEITDNTAPKIQTILRKSASPTNLTTLSYLITFSEKVTGVNNTDFRVVTTTGTATGTIGTLSGSGESYELKINSISGDGTLKVVLNSPAGAGIKDEAGILLTAAFDSAEVYTVDRTKPSLLKKTIVQNDIANDKKLLLTFASNENLQSAIITFNGQPTTLTSSDQVNWTAEYTASASGPQLISYTLNLRDLAGNQINPSQNLQIPLLNLSGASVVEQSPGILIGTVSVTGGGSAIYHLVSGAGSVDNNSFSIVNNELKTTETFTYANKSTYTIRIAAETSDSAYPNGVFYERPFTISVLPRPTDLSLSSSSIGENNQDGDSIGILSAAYPNSGYTNTYSIIGAEDQLFSIEGNLLKAKKVFDYAEKNSYTVHIRSEDVNSSTFEKDFEIKILGKPKALTLSNPNITESNNPGEVIGTLATSHSDSSATFTYEIVSVNDGSDLSDFSIVNDKLVAATSLHFATASEFKVIIRSTDNNGFSMEKPFTISVLARPTDVSLSSSSIGEDNQVGDMIGTLSTAYPNGGYLHSYTVINASGLIDTTVFSINGTLLKAKQVFDYATKNTYTVRIKSEDINGSFYEKDFTIEILGKPKALTLSNSNITESNNPGAFIGTLTTSHSDPSATFTYEIVSVNDGSDLSDFSIVNDKLVAATALHFATASEYKVIIRSTDNNGFSAKKPFTISVLARPTDISLSSLSISENNQVGDVIGTLSTVYPNSGYTHSYALVDNANFPDNTSFSIDGNLLKAKRVFDYATKNTYIVRIKSEDINGSFYEKDFTIEILGKPKALTLSNSNITESNNPGAFIGTLATSHSDPSATFTYEIVSVNNGSDLSDFSIVNDKLVAATSLHFATASEYKVIIRSTDSNGFSMEKPFTISVLARPTDVLLSSSSIGEDNQVGAVIGTLSTVYPNSGYTQSYTLINNSSFPDNTSFSIDGNLLKAKQVFDYATKNTYIVRIKSEDSNGSSFEKTFEIKILGKPKALTLSNPNITESNNPGAFIGTIATSHSDPSATFTYEIVSVNNGSDVSDFSIVNDKLAAATSLHFATASEYKVIIRSTDSNGFSMEKPFTISVLARPTDVLLSSSSIGEDNQVGDVIGTLSTVYPNSGYAKSYTLINNSSFPDNTSFSIDGNLLKAKQVFDYATKNTYIVRIKSEDINGSSFEKAFEIKILGKTKALTLNGSSIRELNDPDAVIGVLSTSNPDLSAIFTYEILSVDDSSDLSNFSIIDNKLIAKKSFRFETASEYKVIIRSTDNNGFSIEKPFTISILARPTNLSLSSSNIGEKNDEGDVIGTLSTAYPNGGYTHSYALVDNSNFPDNASFKIEGNLLKASKVFDYTIKNTYTIRIKSEDINASTVEKTLNIKILGKPKALVLNGSSITELNDPGEVIGVLNTSHPDPNATFTYEVISANDSLNQANFSIVDNKLVATTSFYFELAEEYKVVIRSTDNNGFSIQNSFIVEILSENEAPTGISLNNETINEGNKKGDLIGKLYTTDPDDEKKFTYVFENDQNYDNKYFTIDGDLLKANEIFDYAKKKTYVILLKSLDKGNEAYKKSFTIYINAKPRDLTINNNKINEKNSVGQIIGTFSSIDPNDSEDFGTGMIEKPTNFYIYKYQSVLPDFRPIEDEAFRLLNYVFSTQAFKEALLARAFACSNANTKCRNGLATEGQCDLTIGKVPGATIYRSIMERPNTGMNYGTNVGLDVEIKTAPASSRAKRILGVSSPCYDAINVYSWWLVDNRSLPLAHSVATNIAHEYMHMIGYKHSTHPKSEDVSYGVGDIVKSIFEKSLKSFSYELVSGEGSDDNKYFTISGNKLAAGAIFNYSNKNLYKIRVRTTDSNGLIYEKAMTISVNALPKDILLSENSIVEGNQPNDTIGELSTINPDPSALFTYTLTAPDGTNNNDLFQISGNKLQAKATFTQPGNNYTVRILSANTVSGLSIEKTFTITINSSNLNLTLSSNKVIEGFEHGGIIGALQATSIIPTATFNYVLVDGSRSEDNRYFKILGNELIADSVLLYPEKGFYNVRLRAESTNYHLSYDAAFSIYVNAIPTDISLSKYTINEGNIAQVEIGTLSTTNSDPNAEFTYSFQNGDGSEDNDLFEISGDRLLANTEFRYKLKSNYRVRVRTSNNLTGLSFEKALAISVNAKPTDIFLSNLNINEGNKIGTEIGLLSTASPYSDGIFTYSIVADGESADNQSFVISGNKLLADTVFDYSAKKSYSIQIRTSDQASGLSLEKTFIISINAKPTNISLSNLNITEGNTIGAEVGLFSTSNPDADAVFNYSLVDDTSTDNYSFSISGNKLLANTVFNFATKKSYTARIRSINQNNGLSIEKTFTININAKPTGISLSNLNINEGNSLGAEIGILNTVIPDLSTTFVYSLESKEGSGDNNSFLISGNKLLANTVFKYAIKHNYNILIKTTNTVNGLSFEQSFTLNVLQAKPPTPPQPILSRDSESTSEHPAISGTAGAGLTIIVYVDGVEVGTTTVDQNGHWIFIFNPPLAVGDHQVSIVVKNSSGELSDKSPPVTIVITDKKINAVNNIMTPNGDGINDVLIIENLKQPNQIEIFDRAGRIIYSKQNYDNSWTGTLDGSYLDTGTYYYYLKQEGEKLFKGFVTIIR